MRLPLLVLHTGAGIVGLLSGIFALSYRKGSQGHRAAGDVFVVAMLMMGACASVLALMKHQTNNVFGGFLTIYLVATAWLTGRRKSEAGALDFAAMVFGMAVGVCMWTMGIMVANGRAEPRAGVPIGMYFFMGTIALLAAAGDLRMMLRGGISGRPRLVRHLWRMCFGLFMATGSFFLGQQQVFPDALRKQYLLVPFAVLPLFVLIYWLVRVRFVKRGLNMTLSEQASEA